MEEEKKPFVVRDKRSSATSSDEEETKHNEESKPTEKGEETPAASRKETNIPPITFSTFVLSLSSSAAMNLGGYQDPVSGHIPKNLELAKQSIDILAILKDKTEGNLNREEEKLLESTLYELRMKYVEEVKKS